MSAASCLLAATQTIIIRPSHCCDRTQSDSLKGHCTEGVGGQHKFHKNAAQSCIIYLEHVRLADQTRTCIANLQHTLAKFISVLQLSPHRWRPRKAFQARAQNKSKATLFAVEVVVDLTQCLPTVFGSFFTKNRPLWSMLGRKFVGIAGTPLFGRQLNCPSITAASLGKKNSFTFST